MASGKRQPSKQKRYSQNKQQRAALQVRKAAANASPAGGATPQAKKPRRWGRAAQAARTAPPAAPIESPVDEPEHDDEPTYEPEVVEATYSVDADEPVAVEPVAVEPVAVEEPAEPAPAPSTLLGRLRRPEEVNLPRAATGALNLPKPSSTPAATPAPAPAPKPATTPAARPTPAATSRTTPRPASVREAASAGKARAERRSNAQQRAALQPPGYRAALTGLLLGFAAVLLVALSAVPVNHAGDLYTTDRLIAQWAVPALHSAQHTASTSSAAVVRGITDKQWESGRHVKRVLNAEWPISLAILLPLLGAYLTFRSVRQRRTARIVTRSVYITMLGALISINIYSAFFPVLITVISVTVASYQVRKAETAAAAAAAGVGVIDADVVE